VITGSVFKKMDLIKRILLALSISEFFFFIFSFTGECQDYSFREYMVRDGLPQSEGTLIYQDSRGFLWISTKNGLSRFDGIDFINYYKKDGLPSNHFSHIIEDRRGDLWVLSNEGFSKYTGEGFIFYPPGNEFIKTFFGPVATITDQPGKFIVLARGSDDPYNQVVLFDNGVYKPFLSQKHPFSDLKVVELCYDTTFSDLLIIDTFNNFWSYKDETLIKIWQRGDNHIFYDRGKILVFYGDSCFEYYKRKLLPHHLENNEGRPEVQFVQSRPDDFIRYFDGSQLININLPFRPVNALSDQEGTIWFPSEKNVFRLISTTFTSLSKNLLNMTNPWTICMDNAGHLWIGSLFGDLVEYDGTSFIHRNEYRKLFPGNVSFYKGSRLLSNGEMWLSLNTGVLIWDGSKFSRFKGIPDNTQICYIYEDPLNHKILLGTDRGMFIIDRGAVTCFPRFNDNDLGVIEGAARDDSGFYWLSGHLGIVRFDGKNADPVREKILPGTFTYNIEEDSRGGVWVSSDDGLFCKKKPDRNFSYGLPAPLNKTANALKIMDNSHLLVGRAADICLIDLDKFYNNEKDYYRFYDKTDGYPGDDCLDNGIIKGNNGSFWILTSDNVIRLDPGRLRKNLVPPRTYFTGLFYETDSLTWQPACKNEFYFRVPSEVSLDRHHNNIRITFTGISTVNPERVRYTFKLEDLDSKWSLPSEKREVVYENLMPGRYSFKIKGINADGSENPEPTSLNFRIQPAFYETTLFRILIPLILISVTFIVTRSLVRRNHLKKEENQKVKSELLKLQVNSVLREFDPHFTFNAISSVGSLIMKNNRDEAYRYLTKLSAMLRSVISDGSSIFKTLAGEVDFVRNYCELQKLRFGERFSYSISVSDNVDMQMEVPKMTIQTFVENAVKHGLENKKEGGGVEIFLSHRENFTEITISDNGIGREASLRLRTGGTGNGLKTLKRIFEILNRMNRLKSTFEIIDLSDNGLATGTKAVIYIPDNYSFRTEELNAGYV
jgi:ligand-binding sensor domain-containing protein